MSRADAEESALRALVGNIHTALPGDLALRAREVSQPSAADEAEAARTLVIKHGRVVEER